MVSVLLCRTPLKLTHPVISSDPIDVIYLWLALWIGDKRDGNKAVARIRMGVTSPTLGLGIGFVHFDTPGDWIGRELTLEDAKGNHHTASIVDVPFFDPERKIVRGIDRTIPPGPTK